MEENEAAFKTSGGTGRGGSSDLEHHVSSGTVVPEGGSGGIFGDGRRVSHDRVDVFARLVQIVSCVLQGERRTSGVCVSEWVGR